MKNTSHLASFAVILAASLTIGAQYAQAQYAPGAPSTLSMAEMEKQYAQMSARVKALQDYYATVVQSVNELSQSITQERQKNAQLEKKTAELEREVAELRKALETSHKQTEEAMSNLVDKIAKETANAISSAMKSAAPPSSSGGGAGATGGGGDYDEYKVQPGATLHTIAKAYGVSVEAIQKANNLKGDAIKEGQILKIPKKK